MITIKSYRNGNTLVMLRPDGTKVREWKGTAIPIHPESIDLKITNRCDGSCAWCHENAVPDGEHADISWILETAEGLPRGVEIAIGGGNPFSHPKLECLCCDLAKKGLIVNVTVNSKHLRDAASTIQKLRAVPALWGLGVSWVKAYERQIDAIMDGNTVVHTILGLHSIFDIVTIAKKYPKVLVLGYKEIGRAKTFTGVDLRNENVDLLFRFLEGVNSVVAFDNLAIEQMGLRSRLSDAMWAERYMGDDGEFTMYVDAVKRQYAASSTSIERKPMGDMTVTEAFQRLRRKHASV